MSLRPFHKSSRSDYSTSGQASNWQRLCASYEFSASAIDLAYEAARSAGAVGGKILGAGAGGFLMFYAREEFHEPIRRALSHLRQMRFAFEPSGSVILLDDRKRRYGSAFLKGLEVAGTFPAERLVG